MKRITSILLALTVSTSLFAQKDAKAVLTDLGQMTDQFDRPFDPISVKDKLIIVFVPGTDDPFDKIYDKLKGKTLKKNDPPVQFVGGFAEILEQGGGHGSDKAGMKGHIQEAFVNRYGKDHFSILLDTPSKLADDLSLGGLSIIEISKKTGKIKILKAFGTDRKKFFDAIKTYFN